jgi:trans-aconitate methyltransferase
VWEKGKGVVELLAPNPGERILDLGCGTGHLTAEIASRGAHVLGVDRSSTMLDQARRQFPDIQFAVADARAIGFSAEFDAVFSNAALHWIPQAAEVIAGIAKALKPGGRFVAEFGGKGNTGRLVNAIETTLAKYRIAWSEVNPWYYPSIAEYAALLEQHGIELRAAELFDRPTPLEDAEQGLATWLEMFGASFLNRLPDSRRAAFVRDVEAAARPDLWKNGSWVIDYRRLRIAAYR